MYYKERNKTKHKTIFDTLMCTLMCTLIYLICTMHTKAFLNDGASISSYLQLTISRLPLTYSSTTYFHCVPGSCQSTILSHNSPGSTQLMAAAVGKQTLTLGYLHNTPNVSLKGIMSWFVDWV